MSRFVVGLRTAVFGGLGAALAVAAALSVLAPGLGVAPWLAALAGAVGDPGPTATMLAVGLVAAGYLLVAARGDGTRAPTRDAADERFAALAERPPETVTADRRPATGAAFDDAVDRAAAGDAEALATVRDRLAATAATAHAARTGADRGAARRAVSEGTWTDDRTAAAFLSGEAGPSPSLGARVRLWLAPERERRRRVDRAVAAVERERAEVATA